jgi:hypothetical protein
MALDTTASTLLWTRPDWFAPASWLPVVAAYVALTRAGDDTCLVVDASDGTVAPQLALELLAAACEALTGDAPFGDLLILDSPQEPPVRALPVSDADAVAAVLGRALPTPPPDPQGALDHARWAKRLCDAARDRLDRHRFETAPDPFADPRPLVSVRIPTFGDVDALLTRTLPSVLHGEWQRLEVVVCSDGPQPHARAAIESVADPRVRYVEVPARPTYPTHFYPFWQVAGSHAVNHAVAHCEGSFICPLDHDDAFSGDHIPALLSAALRERSDFVYGQAFCERRDGTWRVIGSAPMQHAHIVHSTVMYSSRLRHLQADATSWLLDEPGDWNLWRRMVAAGASPAFVRHPVLAHFRERTAIEHQTAGGDGLSGHVEVSPEALVESLHATEARRLLAIPRPVAATSRA